MKKLVDILFPVNVVYAHCDIPCGIYDPHNAQTAAHTVIRMTKMIDELNFDQEEASALKKLHQQIARLTKVKEDHAEIVKREVVILWGDYFKEEHLKDYPTLSETVFQTLKLASKTKQEINLEAARELVEKVQAIAEIFYKTKGVKTNKVKAPYPTEGDLIVPA